MASIRQLTPFISVSEQLSPAEVAVAASEGFRTIINNRPDRESEDQPASAELAERCAELGVAYHHLPVVPGQVTDEQVDAFTTLLGSAQGPVLAFCRTGTRSTTLWALSEASHLEPQALVEAAAAAGCDISGLSERLASRRREAGGTAGAAAPRHDVVIVGGGAGGVAAAASLLRRRPGLDLVIIDPPTSITTSRAGPWSGGGVFEARDHLPPDGRSHSGRRALDQGRRRQLRPGKQRGRAGRRQSAVLPRADRRARHQAGLGARRGA